MRCFELRAQRYRTVPRLRKHRTPYYKKRLSRLFVIRRIFDTPRDNSRGRGLSTGARLRYSSAFWSCQLGRYGHSER